MLESNLKSSKSRSKNTTSFTTADVMPSNLEHLIFTLSPLLTA